MKAKLYLYLVLAVALLASAGLQGCGYDSRAEAASDEKPQTAQSPEAAEAVAPAAEELNQPARREDPPGDAYQVAPERISVARADLVSCTSPDLTPQHPGNLDIEAFGRNLNGTWVRQLTWSGVPIETESAIYFEVKGNSGWAMMVDRANMGRGPLAERADQRIKNLGTRLRTPTLTFVDCEYKIRDQYFKISDQLIFDGMPVRRGKAQEPKKTRLESVWADLLSQGFLDRAKAELSTDLINQKPDGDMFLPATVGALWKVSLTPESRGDYWGARLYMQGQYHGTLAGLAGRGTLPGIEDAHFFMEGSRFVAARLPKELASRKIATKEATGTELGWETDCSSFLGLDQDVNWERVVLDPGTL